MRFILFFMPLLLLTVFVHGQTCCSGGVPVSSNLGFDGVEKNILHSSFSWDYNYLNTLKEGTKIIQDDSRKRVTNSFLVQVGYGITERFSIDALGSIVQQRRLISQSNGFRDEDITLGVGDITTLIKYQVLSSARKISLNAGIGVKLPVGRYDFKDTDGIYYNADLQPGSGAWDLIYRVQSTYTPHETSPWNIHAIAIYSNKTTNHDYLRPLDSYTFGDELQVSMGYGHQLFIRKQVIDLSVNVRYRNAWQDLFNNGKLPATGGSWLFATPGFTYWFDPNTALTAQITLPLYANVMETQLTPTIRTTVGFNKKFKL